MLPTVNPAETESWRKLTAHFMEMQAVHMRQLFQQDAQRFQSFQAQFEDILIDYSKNIVTDETLRYLEELAEECGLRDAITAMFSGDAINQAEGRPVLHVALRNRGNTPVRVLGEDVMPEVNRVLGQMKSFSEKVLGG